jgi:hypothetical protein
MAAFHLPVRPSSDAPLYLGASPDGGGDAASGVTSRSVENAITRERHRTLTLTRTPACNSAAPRRRAHDIAGSAADIEIVILTAFRC